MYRILIETTHLNLFTCLLGTPKFSLVRCLFESSVHFFSWAGLSQGPLGTTPKPWRRPPHCAAREPLTLLPIVTVEGAVTPSGNTPNIAAELGKAEGDEEPGPAAGGAEAPGPALQVGAVTQDGGDMTYNES